MTASKRYATLWKAAQLHGDRLLRRHGYRLTRLPRRVANAWSVQSRGVWHVHEALPFGTPVERLWSRAVVEYMHRFGSRYGWGWLDRNPLRGRGREGYSVAETSRYLARNAAGYLAENANGTNYLPGRLQRSYVSRRLTTQTGVTIRRLRQCRYLWVCCKLGLELPESWDDDLVELLGRLAGIGPTAVRAP